MPQLLPAVHNTTAVQGDEVKLAVDLGHFKFRRVRVMIFEIPEEGIKDPQTGILIKRDNYENTIDAANRRDKHKIYQRARNELWIEQKAAGQKGKHFSVFKWDSLDEDANTMLRKNVFIPVHADPGPYLVKVKIINKNGIIVSRSFINLEAAADLEAVTDKLASNIETQTPEKQAEFLKAANFK